MVNSVNIPIIVDADDGYGGALAAYRTTQELIRIGAGGIFIDDQKHPTKCPFMGIQEVIPRDEFYGKMEAVLEARNKEDKDLIIVARIDAAATLGDEEMLARAKACVKLGVDVILPHGIPPGAKFKERNKETLKKLTRRLERRKFLFGAWVHFTLVPRTTWKLEPSCGFPNHQIASLQKLQLISIKASMTQG